MSETKSDKELAFLRDLYVATDWGERFSALLDENIELPKKGRVLYIEAGTGGHAMALLEDAEEDVRMVCVDESEECIELARAKAVAMNIEPEFLRGSPDSLELRDQQFDMVIADGSMVAPSRVAKMISEAARVTMPGGNVAMVFATSSSFGEFFSIYWEALQSSGFENQAKMVENLVAELPTIASSEDVAETAGLANVQTLTVAEEFTYESGEDFTNSPLITDFFMRSWTQSLGDVDQTRLFEEIARLIDEERQDADFILSVKATIVVGVRK